MAKCLELLCGRDLARVGVVDAVDRVLSHEDDVRVDLGRAQGSGGVAREERVPRPRGEDHDVALLEVVDRPPADIGLGDLGDRDRGLNAHLGSDGLELALQRQGVDDHGEHAHVMRGRLFDAVFGDRGAAHDVAATDDDGDLRAEVMDLLDLLGEVTRVLRGDAERTLAEDRLAGEL